ncbi:YIP1 family protein [Shimia sp. MMG029]|uniref:YIP1 family protein n=1 Tax=Shimia sp. MMG029 TaxID=3021978 RepID=UPI0022FE6785|nr:YIP1 family protein [Shimia sp. MMG029]MDA5555728.1 YIP1 family protein [Shimia sp. MMG029]
MKEQLGALFWLTIRDPAEAALAIMSRPVARQIGWMILTLGIILNVLAHFLTLAVFPAPADLYVPMLQTPFLYAGVMGSGLVILVYAFFWGGHAIGGRGRFDDLLLALGWLQYMRFVVQLLVLVLMVVLPGLALLVSLGVGLYSIWIVLHFVNVIHGFGSLGKTFVLLLFTSMGLVLAMSLLLSITATTSIGIS